MSARPIPRLSPEEYLALDRSAEVKSEYYDGRIIAMAGGSLAHSLIASNIGAELRAALKGRDCSVYQSDVRVRSTSSSYSYPDVTVVCGSPKVAGDRDDILLNPMVIVEVLSPSTELLDRGTKFLRYREMESLQEYVLVSRDEPRIEIFRRGTRGTWLLAETLGLNSRCQFDSLGCSIPMEGVYDRVAFSPDQLI